MAEGDSPSEFHIAPSGDFEVRAVALDEWRVDINCPPPDLVKIDVEGAEVPVLRGSVQTFKRWRAPIHLSLHGQQQRCECAGLLEKWGYRVVSTEGSVSGSSERLAEPASCSEF
jgi:methyltransferase FkbM-like protein